MGANPGRGKERKSKAKEVIGIKLEQERRELEQKRMEHERMIEKQQEFEKSTRDKTEKKK